MSGQHVPLMYECFICTVVIFPKKGFLGIAHQEPKKGFTEISKYTY